MSNLIIVESPTKARTLSRFLGKDYLIEATMGHVRDLPENRLGIEIKIKNGGGSDKKEYEFVPDYQIISDRKKRVAELRKIAKDVSKIILATDPDREGEAIAYHVAELIRPNLKGEIQNSKIKRIVFHEITESAIKDAMLNPRDIDIRLVDAQQARRILDRLVGYKLSPLLWNKLSMRWLSAGRVQTVAVRLIVEREREIQAFKPEEYWLIEVELQKIQDNVSNPEIKQDTKIPFIARLIQIGDEKAEIKNKEEADRIVADLKFASYQVENIETKEVRRYPSPPFTTSTMQQAASNKFGWSAKRTMRAAQGLYEEGLITYHRTDSTNLSNEAIKMAREYINNVYGESYLPSSPRIYKTKSKVAQEAHEAIRPTNIKILGNYDMRRLKEDIRQKHSLKMFDRDLGRDGELLYGMIWKRFLASQMNEAVFDQTTVEIKATKQTNSYLLKATGEQPKFAGWLVIYGDGENNNSSEKKILPQLTKGEILHLLQILPQQKFTEPPARYTEASLIKALEEKGIGRPSTYAPIISTIQERKYVEKVELSAGKGGKRFQPTPLGFTVVDFLVKHFPEIFDVLFTAKMEDELDEIANGILSWQAVINDFYRPFHTKLDWVSKEAEKVKVDLGKTEEKCPDCGATLVIKLSKYGKFLACPNFPNCKYTKNIIERAGITCPRCGGDIILRKTRRGKQFYGCINYPKCDFAAWKKEDIK